MSPVAFAIHLETVFSTRSPLPSSQGKDTSWAADLLGWVTHSFFTQDSVGSAGRSRPGSPSSTWGQSCVVFKVLLCRSCLWVPPMELIKMQSSQACAPDTLTCGAQVVLGTALLGNPSAHYPLESCQLTACSLEPKT